MNPPVTSALPYASVKARFLASKIAVDLHKDLTGRPEFIGGLDVAFQSYCEELSTEDQPMKAGASFYKMQGAKEFIDRLKRLGESQPVIPSRILSEPLKR